MSFRFRRSARLGPLRFNFAKGGLSSISLGSPARGGIGAAQQPLTQAWLLPCRSIGLQDRI
jgi:hypothetical protein